MKLDFVTRVQLAENVWGHWGQWGHQQRRGFRCPHVPSPRWGQLGTWRHRCVICSCKFLRFVPICPHLSPGGERRKTQCWRGVPNVPSVPIENAQVSIGTVSVATAPAQSGFRIHGLFVSHTPVCQLPRGIRTFSLVCSFQALMNFKWVAQHEG